MKLVLKPGDCLLYRNTWSFIGWLIRVKSWSPVNHVEVYIGDGHTISARSYGSRVYPLQRDGLFEVWRPREMPMLGDAMAWFMGHANGQRYDFFGLFRFFTIGKQSHDKQFCSELATRWYRAAGIEPFTPETDADLVSPGMFRTSGQFTRIWAKE